MNLAVKQIKGEDDYAESQGESDSSGDEEKQSKKFVDSANMFGVKALKVRPNAGGADKELDAEKVLKAARRVTGGNPTNDTESD